MLLFIEGAKGTILHVRSILGMESYILHKDDALFQLRAWKILCYLWQLEMCFGGNYGRSSISICLAMVQRCKHFATVAQRIKDKIFELHCQLEVRWLQGTCSIHSLITHHPMYLSFVIRPNPWCFLKVVGFMKLCLICSMHARLICRRFHEEGPLQMLYGAQSHWAGGCSYKV